MTMAWSRAALKFFFRETRKITINYHPGLSGHEWHGEGPTRRDQYQTQRNQRLGEQKRMYNFLAHPKTIPLRRPSKHRTIFQ